jgi:hypothetical protein
VNFGIENISSLIFYNSAQTFFKDEFVASILPYQKQDTMKKIYLLLVILFASISVAQTTISGKVINKKNKALVGVNVFIDGTYDGALTNEQGEFSFTTDSKSSQILKFSLNSYIDLTENIIIETYQNKIFTLQQEANNIEAVVISAGTIKAGDNSKVSTLKALDIVTTAGAAGDIVAAFETMPGVNAVGESGRLFVRGGDANETQTFIDGIRVAQPYGASPGNVPTRSRFSPFLFKGITFSTGGYSAEFGDALSSVLLLNTKDDEIQNQSDISIMTVGLGFSKSKKWKKSSISLNTSYFNLEPYNKLIPQNLDWIKAPESIGGEVVFRTKIKNGLLKWYVAFDNSSMNLNQKDINFTEKINFKLSNSNFYMNATYKGSISNNLKFETGGSFGHNKNKVGINNSNINNNETSLHYKFKVRNNFSNFLKLNAGAEYFFTNYKENYNFTNFEANYKNDAVATFAETELYFSTNFVMNVGVRGHHSSITNKFYIEPRVSLAYKTGEKSQISLAYGTFNQTPNQEYLKFTTNLNLEKTNHYIFNYLYNEKGKIFRAEAYFKDYNNLAKFNGNSAAFTSNYNNNGYGYAKGFDLFWRDNKSIKNLDYWVTYSFVDTQRDFKNFTKQVTPNFVANHNFSVVTKYWINKLKSQLGVTYTFNSGRPYDNPNEAEFMNQKTKSYNSLSLGWSYLISQQKIIYISMSNLLNANNIFGYQYANNSDLNGVFQRQEITQQANRFFFIGFFWTISDNKKTNQLDNL